MLWRIYRVTSPSGKLYFGVTKALLSERWRQHKSKRSGCVKLKTAIKKYGAENFQLTELAYCEDKATATALERALISIFDTIRRGYNITTGGEGTSRLFCTRGHEFSVVGKTRGECSVCILVRRAENLELTNKQRRDNRNRDPAKIAAHNEREKTRYADNPEPKKQRQNAEYAANPEPKKQQSRLWRANVRKKVIDRDARLIRINLLPQ